MVPSSTAGTFPPVGTEGPQLRRNPNALSFAAEEAHRFGCCSCCSSASLGCTRGCCPCDRKEPLSHFGLPGGPPRRFAVEEVGQHTVPTTSSHSGCVAVGGTAESLSELSHSRNDRDIVVCPPCDPNARSFAAQEADQTSQTNPQPWKYHYVCRGPGCGSKNRLLYGFNAEDAGDASRDATEEGSRQVRDARMRGAGRSISGQQADWGEEPELQNWACVGVACLGLVLPPTLPVDHPVRGPPDASTFYRNGIPEKIYIKPPSTHIVRPI